MKKFLAVVLVMLTAIGLFAGCGEQGGKIVMEDMDKVPEDTYEIQWYLMGDAQNDVESVEKEINKYLKDTDIIVHTTPNGMYPNNNDEPLVYAQQMNPNMVIFDIVYNLY